MAELLNEAGIGPWRESSPWTDSTPAPSPAGAMRTERPGIVVAGLIVALAACQAAPIDSPAAATSTRTAAAETPSEPAACVDVFTPSTDGGLIPGTLAEVVTDDLVMRTAPRISDDSPLLPATLNAPDIVHVEHGPIHADGYAWYLVLPDGAGADHGWVADASRDGEPWVRSLGAEGSWCILRSVALPDGPNLGGAAAGLDGRIYVFGGQGGPAAVEGFPAGPRSWAYEPASDSWAELAPMPFGRPGLVALAADGRFWVFLPGIDVVDPDQPLIVRVYDPASDRWQAEPPIAPVPQAVAGAMAWARDGDILSVRWETISIFDPSSGNLSQFPTIRASGLVVTQTGELYLVGEEGGFSALDQELLAAGPLHSSRFLRYGMSTAAMGDGRLVAVGGYAAAPCAIDHIPPDVELAGADLSGQGMPLAEAFDPRSATWTTLAPLPTGLNSATAVGAGDDLYVVMDTPFGVTVARYLPTGGEGVDGDAEVDVAARGCPE